MTQAGKAGWAWAWPSSNLREKHCERPSSGHRETFKQDPEVPTVAARRSHQQRPLLIRGFHRHGHRWLEEKEETAATVGEGMGGQAGCLWVEESPSCRMGIPASASQDGWGESTASTWHAACNAESGRCAGRYPDSHGGSERGAGTEVTCVPTSRCLHARAALAMCSQVVHPVMPTQLRGTPVTHPSWVSR